MATLLPASPEPRQKVKPSRVARFRKYGFYLSILTSQGPSEFSHRKWENPSRELITLGRLKSWI